MKQRITTLITVLSINGNQHTILSIKIPSIVDVITTLRISDSQHNDSQHDGSQHEIEVKSLSTNIKLGWKGLQWTSTYFGQWVENNLANICIFGTDIRIFRLMVLR